VDVERIPTEASPSIFITAAHVQGATQVMMNMEHFEQKTLLCHNADLIRKNIVSFLSIFT